MYVRTSSTASSSRTEQHSTVCFAFTLLCFYKKLKASLNTKITCIAFATKYKLQLVMLYYGGLIKKKKGICMMHRPSMYNNVEIQE